MYVLLTNKQVFDVFNYLDGDRHDNAHYADTAYKEHGISPDASGNISVSDITKIGEIGGFDVDNISSVKGYNLKTGKTLDGDHMLIVIVNDDGLQHIVKVNEIVLDDHGQVERYLYFDATSGGKGEALPRNTHHMYRVGEKEDSSGGLTSTPQPSGSIQPSGNFD